VGTHTNGGHKEADWPRGKTEIVKEALQSSWECGRTELTHAAAERKKKYREAIFPQPAAKR
jgi:hypothetical protein